MADELNIKELEEPCKTSDEAFEKLEEIASHSNDYIFRGLKDSDYRLTTTYHRYKPLIRQSWDEGGDITPGHPEIKNMIKLFKDSLVRIGKHPDIEDNSFEWLEYARHFGVPMPLLDFTRSPYIALFFAFNGISKIPDDSEQVKVCALNFDSLAKIWTEYSLMIEGKLNKNRAIEKKSVETTKEKSEELEATPKQIENANRLTKLLIIHYADFDSTAHFFLLIEF